MTGISITRGARQHTVECETCNNDVLDAEASRAKVRAHVKATGHTVYVLVEEGTYYRPEKD